MCVGCMTKRRDEAAIRMTHVIVERLIEVAVQADSLKARVLSEDPQALRYMVRFPGGGFGFSDRYLQLIDSNPAQMRLVQACNTSVCTYTSLSSYVQVQLLPRLPKQLADSFAHHLPAADY